MYIILNNEIVFETKPGDTFALVDLGDGSGNFIILKNSMDTVFRGTQVDAETAFTDLCDAFKTKKEYHEIVYQV